MRSHQTIVAVACLTLGAAEVAYLNLEVAPGLVAAGSDDETARDPESVAAAAPSSPPAAIPAASAATTDSPAATIAPDQRTEPAAAPALAGSVRSIQIVFGRDEAHLGPGERARLDEIAAEMAVEPELNATVDGHTDRLGEPEHNDELSQRRAAEVASYLVDGGVDRSRLTVRWFGERQPLPFDREGADPRNRRVDIRLAEGRVDTTGGVP
jgi:outer membrane protein OmpA-like peptidoglycan-associated protein